MLTKEQEKIIKKIGISQQDLYSLFVSKEFMKEHKLIFWFKEDAPEGVVIKVSNDKKGYNDNFQIIYIFSKNNIDIFIDGFYLPKSLQHKGIATRCLYNLIVLAQKIDRPLLIAKCGRNDDEKEVGYIVWPRLGFNGLSGSKKVELLKAKYCKEKRLGADLKKKIMDTKDIVDLCSFEAGVACRQEIGRMFDGEFDLSKNSKSMRTFNRHMKKYK